MKQRNIKISLIINIIIVLLTVFATIIMFTGFRFMHGSEPILETTKFGVFKFFTVDSNVFMGIVSLAFIIEETKLLKGKIKDISKTMYIFKLMSTTAVTITFLTVFLYLGPISDGGIISMLQNSNLFFHFIIPVLSIITFILFEKTDKLELKNSLYGIIPTLLYASYYVTNILIHMENGKVSPIYDWYWFVQNGVLTAFIVAPFMLLIAYITSLLLWKINKIRR
jgi:hypothetical protein